MMCSIHYKENCLEKVPKSLQLVVNKSFLNEFIGRIVPVIKSNKIMLTTGL